MLETGLSSAHLPESHKAKIGASLVAQLVKNPPVMQDILVQFLGWEDPLEKDRLLSSVLGLPLWLSW